MKRKTLLLISLIFTAILFSACSENPDEIRSLMKEKLKLNKKYYSIKIGEKVKIYYTMNSCCPVCTPKLNKLVAAKFLGIQTEISRECLGCNFLYSLNFKGVRKGVDTVFSGIIVPNQNCDSITVFKNFRKYVIRVN